MTVGDLELAVEAMMEKEGRQLDYLAIQAAWIVNHAGMRGKAPPIRWKRLRGK